MRLSVSIRPFPSVWRSVRMPVGLSVCRSLSACVTSRVGLSLLSIRLSVGRLVYVSNHPSICLSFSLSLSLSLALSLSLPLYLPTRRPTNRCVNTGRPSDLSACRFIYPSTYLTLHLSINLATDPSMFGSVDLSIILHSICPPACLPIHPYIYICLLTYHLPVYMYTYLSIHVSIYLPTSPTQLCNCLPIYLPIYLSFDLSVYESACPSTHLSVFLCGCLSICPYACRCICLSVYKSLESTCASIHRFIHLYTCSGPTPIFLFD